MAEILGRQRNVGFQYYGDKLIKSRKLLRESLNASAVSSTWSSVIDRESIRLLHRFRDSEETFYEDVQRFESRSIPAYSSL